MKDFTIKELSEKTGLSTVYLRRMIHKNKLQSTVRNIDGTNIPRHHITQEQFDEFRSNTKTRTQRTDNRNKYTVYMTVDEMKQIRKLLKESKQDEVEKLLVRSNPRKSK